MIRRGESGWVDVGRAFMVARWRGCERVPPPCQQREQDAGDHKGPPNRSSPPSPLREGYFPLWMESHRQGLLEFGAEKGSGS